jgi:hypothetical protein
MYFAFIPKGPDGKLIVSKARVPAKAIADAKKEIGGGAPIIGKCTGGEDGTIVFTVAKAMPSLGPALKKVAQRDAGMMIKPDVQVASDAEADDAGAPAAPAPTPAPAVPAAPAASGAGAAPAGPAAAEGGAANLAAWEKARENAIKDLKALAAKVVATKHSSAVGVLKEINSIITKLPARPEPQDVDKLEAFVRADDTITAAEEVPAHFHKIEIRKPLLDALQAMKN